MYRTLFKLHTYQYFLNIYRINLPTVDCRQHKSAKYFFREWRYIIRELRLSSALDHGFQLGNRLIEGIQGLVRLEVLCSLRDGAGNEGAARAVVRCDHVDWSDA